MMTCSVCNAQNQTGALFCEMCGSRLTVPAAATAAPVVVPSAVPAPTAAAASGAAGGLQCPTCGHTALPGEAFCDECGTPLAAPVGNPAQAAAQPTPPAQPAPQAAYPPPTPIASAAVNSCPSCSTPTIPGEAFCDNCGASLLGLGIGVQGSGASSVPPAQPAAPPLATPPVQAAPIPSAQSAAPPPATPPVQAAPASQPSRPPTPDPRSLTLANYVLKLANGAIIALPAKAEAVIGREDAPSNNYPEVDLGPHNALAEGVGRRHARLTMQNGQVQIEDLDSTNGTFLNKQRVVARQPTALAAGAELRLGKIAMTFQPRDATP